VACWLILRPINLGVLQIEEVDFIDGRLLVAQGGFGVFTPVVRGGDDDALGEGLLAGGGEEAVDVALINAMRGVVAFALDGVKLFGAVSLGDEIDTGVYGGEAVCYRPICKEPYVGVEVGKAGFVAEVGADEFLEVGAFFFLGLGCCALLCEDALKCGHWFGNSLRRGV
jgi:hypothetical protein